jgi:hypothetical protein
LSEAADKMRSERQDELDALVRLRMKADGSFGVVYPRGIVSGFPTALMAFNYAKYGMAVLPWELRHSDFDGTYLRFDIA